MMFVEHLSCIVNQILACCQDPADRISQVVCRDFQQLHWIKPTLFMRIRGFRVALP